jgi:hypothetical protein
MVALFVTSRLLRKKRKRVTSGPIEKRDKSRIQYMNNKIFKDDTTCTILLRLKKEYIFFGLCQVLRERSLLRDTAHVCVEEHLAMLLNTIGHNLKID